MAFPYPTRATSLLIAVVGFIGLGAAARLAAAQPLTLSMEQVAQRAVEHSYTIIEADKRTAAARTAVERSSAWLAANPHVSGGGSASDSEFDRLSQDASTTRSERFGPSYSFTLQQDVEIAGQRGMRMQASTHGVAVALNDRRNREGAVRAEAKKAFTAALGRSGNVDLAARSTQLFEEVHAGFNPRDPDERRRINYNTSMIQLLRQRRRETAARRELDEATDQLKRLIGLPLEQQITLAGSLESTPRPLPPLAELLHGLADRRADVAAYRSLLARADADLALAKRSLIPDVSVFGFVARFDGGGNTETSGGGSLGINLPIFQDNGPSVADAIAERQRAAAELDDLMLAVEMEMTTLYRRCEEAAAELNLVTDEILPRARENLVLQRRRAERDEVSEYDVVDYDLELISAQSDLLEARRVYTDALIDLERAAVLPSIAVPAASGAAAAAAGAGEQADPEQ